MSSKDDADEEDELDSFMAGLEKKMEAETLVSIENQKKDRIKEKEQILRMIRIISPQVADKLEGKEAPKQVQKPPSPVKQKPKPAENTEEPTNKKRKIIRAAKPALNREEKELTDEEEVIDCVMKSGGANKNVTDMNASYGY